MKLKEGNANDSQRGESREVRGPSGKGIPNKPVECTNRAPPGRFPKPVMDSIVSEL